MTSGPGNSANTTPAKVTPTPLMLSRRSRFDRRSESLSIVSAMALSSSELAREVRDRRISQGLSLRVDNAAVLAILPFRQTRDDARSNRLQLAQPTVPLRRWRPWRGLEQFTILTNARRIDPVSFVATQLRAHEVSNLGGI